MRTQPVACRDLSRSRKRKEEMATRVRRCLKPFGSCIILLTCVAVVLTHSPSPQDRTLVTYAYAEGLGNGGMLDQHNFQYFIDVVSTGLVPGTIDIVGRVDYIFVVSGLKCTPCETLAKSALARTFSEKHVVKILFRDNLGMDFGAYSDAMEYMRGKKRRRYKYFIFINSSLRGPFMPKWTPPSFHFTDTLTDFMRRDQRVKLASSYVTCLHAPEPKVGPIAESLFFAVDRQALHILEEDGIFGIWSNKSDVILQGEYALLEAVLKRGHRYENLVGRYKIGLDWTDSRYHLCNDCRHASRRGALQNGNTANIFEHVFVKTSWCVRAAETAIASKWLLHLASDLPGTEGHFDEVGWGRGISVSGTSGKKGTLPPDVPEDGCMYGDFKDLVVHTRAAES